MDEIETDSSTVKNAADRIMSLLDGTPPDEPEKAEPAEEASDDTHPEEIKAEPEQTTEESKSEEPKSEEPIDDPVTLFTELADHLGVEEDFLENLIVPTKVNGQERQATIKDLIAHYQKGESAELKLMDVAEQKKQFEAESSQRQQQIEQEWGRIQALNEELQSMLTNDDRDIETLRYSDPAEYAARIADRQQRLQRAEKVRQEMLETQAKRSYENYTRMVEIEKNRLMTAIPEWQDEKTASKETADIRGYLKNNGFQDWEIDGKMDNGVVTHTGIIDHRAISLARKAMLYDQTRTGSEPKKAKLKSLPKVGSGKRKTKEDVKVEEVQEVRGRLRKTGSLKDAALAISQMTQRGN